MIKPGLLYIVSTPIGNLGDMSARAINVLSTVDVIACEDTRHSAPLLKHFGIHTRLIALHAHNETYKTEQVVEQLIMGANIAIISDAGTPLIHDPGYELVVLARERGIPVVPVPGACALIAALSASGLPADKFCFEGFLPAMSVARKKVLEDFLYETRTVIFYETPHRIVDSLQDMREVFGGEKQAVMARELTKIYEDIVSGSVDELLALTLADEHKQKGEFVVLLRGAAKKHVESVVVNDEAVLKTLLAELPLKQAVRLATKITGHNKNHLYDMALLLKG